MGNSGNQYANRVFAEHPIALWSLDEDAYFLSLINNASTNDRLFSSWTTTNCDAYDYAFPSLPDAPSPFEDSTYSSITADVTTPVTIAALSDDLFSSTDVSSDVSTFTVNFFLYQKPQFINWFKVGYTYLDSVGDPQEVISGEIPPPTGSGSWVNFNNTYDIPTDWSGSIRLFIQVDFEDTTSADDSSRTVIMNGLSVGQNSQTSCYVSLGSQKISIPSSTGIIGLEGISADQYGVLADNGYYLVRNNNVLAHNDGFPIVFGSNHSTKIYPSKSSDPSLIFPGKGMLNESGRNKEYTLEAWIKIDPATSVARKILGPVSSSDGLYVKEGFLTLVIGTQIASHCVGEWYRPMLVHIILKENNATMLLNGEEVVNIPYSRSTINLPTTNDWWGVYSHTSISIFDIDCISIYPYVVSAIAAKRRFVYGQGTTSVQTIDGGFQGTPTTIDFSTAEYNSNIIYPDVYRWDAGYFNNLTATKGSISVPNYSLPVINIGGRNLYEWYSDNNIVNDLEYPLKDNPKFVTFRPNYTVDESGNPVAWDISVANYTSPSYFNFPTLNILNDPLSSVYGIFEIEESVSESRTLMSFVNVTTGQTFDINSFEDEIQYLVNGIEIYSEVITVGIETAIGINFENAGIYFGYEVSRFFSSPSSIQLYVGGNGNNTFEGKIYSLGFCNQTNYQEISNNFLENGFVNTNNYEILLDHFSSYTLLPEYEYEQLYLDIAVSSSWEEYFPLSYFASYVKDEDGNQQYDLDMIQVNLGYSTVELLGAWTYQELKNNYIGDTYQTLKDDIYANYFNLKKKNTTGNTLNVSNSSLQGFLTFQSLASGANAPLSSFQFAKTLDANYVIDPDLENSIEYPEKAYETKFIFSDNVIVYPPKSKNFEEYAMVMHLNIKQRSILKNPLKVKSLEISSKNLNYNSIAESPYQRNSIGTKFGTKIYPEVYDGSVVDYKTKNPFSIYKTATPYLYTTKKSGVKIVNLASTITPTENEYRISIPINHNASYNFNVAAIQFFILANIPEGQDQIKVLEVSHKEGVVYILLNKDSNGITTMNAYLYNGSSYEAYLGISFYQNGRYVSNPSINNLEWNAIGISFNEQLDFSEYSNGGINLFGGFVFNNVSYYLSAGLGVKSDISVRTWDEVLTEDISGTPVSPENTWLYWSGYSWREVYVTGQTLSYLSTPADIYASYTGTNRNVIDDGFGMMFQEREAIIVSDTTWSLYTDKPT